MKEILYKNKPVKILKILGYDDEYYWDYNIWFTWNEEKFYIVNAGSGSEYIPMVKGIVRGEFKRLYNDKAEFEETMNEDHVEYLIKYLMDKLGDNNSYEEKQNEEDDDEIIVTYKYKR